MTDSKFCKFCGADIPKESHFCLKCGATLTSTSAAERQVADFPHSRQHESSTREPYSPPYYSQEQASRSGLGPSFWLGFVGGVFGILGGVFALFVGSFSEAFSGNGGEFYGLGVGAIIFSILGIVGGAFESRKKVGAALMIISAIGILISISYFGILSCILFLIGGAMMLIRNRRRDI